MIGLIGKKLGHTRVYHPKTGAMTPVTVVLAGPNRVLQVKTKDGKDGYNAVQLGFDDQKDGRLSKAKLGHLKKHAVVTDRDADGSPKSLNGVREIREFRDFAIAVKTGDLLGVDIFNEGDYIDAIGITKGRGFEGVVGRHGFRGGDMTHGAKGWHRRSGAIGCRLFPGHVRRGLKMPGHMGQVQRTVQNLEVVQVRKEDGILLIRGSTPGSEGDYIVIRESKKMSRAYVAKKADEAKAKAAASPKAKKADAKAAPAAKK